MADFLPGIAQALHQITQSDAGELTAVIGALVEAWPKLSPAARRGIIAIVHRTDG